MPIIPKQFGGSKIPSKLVYLAIIVSANKPHLAPVTTYNFLGRKRRLKKFLALTPFTWAKQVATKEIKLLILPNCACLRVGNEKHFRNNLDCMSQNMKGIQSIDRCTMAKAKAQFVD